MKEIIKEIEVLLNSELTDYRISKDTGITLSVIQNYRNGKYELENMTLKIAKKLYDYIKDRKRRSKSIELLKLTFSFKGDLIIIYGHSLDEIVDQAKEYFEGDYYVNEIDEHNYEEFIKVYINGDLRLDSDEIRYFWEIDGFKNISFIELATFVHYLEEEYKSSVLFDEFNKTYYIKSKDDLNQICNHLTRLINDEEN